MTFMDVVVSTRGSAEGRGGFTWTAAADRWAKTAGPIAREAVRNKTPIGMTSNADGSRKASGVLKRSITDRYSAGSGVARVEIGTPLGYVKFVTDGTRPHPIVARHRRALHFITDSGAKVTVRSVNHPGTRANRFVERAMKPALPGIRSSFAEIMREAMGGM